MKSKCEKRIECVHTPGVAYHNTCFSIRKFFMTNINQNSANIN